MLTNNNFKLFLHDAELLTLHIDRKIDSGKLVFRREDNSMVTVNMFEFWHVKCDKFGRQNVVSDFFLSSQGDMSKEFFLEQLTWLCGGMITLTEKQKEEKWERCKEGEMEFIYLSPSVGAELAVLCKRIEIVSNL